MGQKHQYRFLPQSQILHPLVSLGNLAGAHLAAVAKEGIDILRKGHEGRIRLHACLPGQQQLRGALQLISGRIIRQPYQQMPPLPVAQRALHIALRHAQLLRDFSGAELLFGVRADIERIQIYLYIIAARGRQILLNKQVFHRRYAKAQHAFVLFKHVPVPLSRCSFRTGIIAARAPQPAAPLGQDQPPDPCPGPALHAGKTRACPHCPSQASASR